MLLTLFTLAVHAPAALDTADGSPAFALSGQTRGPAHSDAGTLLGCHHGQHHAHSLCAPPVIPVARLAWLSRPTPATIPPQRSILLPGRTERLRHPPPRTFT
ncbi:hypothetical protein [Acidimangrovimonas pyrenivorans]|uniref:Secreted protein n=1 Tax=Acidimangrovimonas pyrenivorans TaxID=2030798 RepID=A0ABV7AFV0_9RHOB